ncbi:hypothetical protein M408DRAFT_35602, partial [Serendipita vermifera MAFF 305830]
ETNGKTIPATVLIDCGAMGFAIMNTTFAKNNEILLVSKKFPIPLEGFDGSPSSAGAITHHTNRVNLLLAQHLESLQLDVAPVAHADIYLGISWLERHNPVINW